MWTTVSCNFYLSVAARPTVDEDPPLIYRLRVAGLSNQEETTAPYPGHSYPRPSHILKSCPPHKAKASNQNRLSVTNQLFLPFSCFRLHQFLSKNNLLVVFCRYLYEFIPNLCKNNLLIVLSFFVLVYTKSV